MIELAQLALGFVSFVKECRKVCKAGSWSPLGGLTGGSRRLWKAFGRLWEPLGKLLGGSWWALGGFQEASWTKDRHSYNCLAFFEKIGDFGEPSWRRFRIKNRIL